MDNKKSGAVLIVGGGIGGIQASLDLADAGFKVYLVEKSPTIGGVMAQLDKTFPTNDCSMCIMSPKLVDCARHLNINLLTCSEVTSINGEEGDFTVTVLRHPRYIDETKCTGCAECETHCPVSRTNFFDEGLSARKAIFRPFPQAAPNIFTIEKAGVPPCRDTCPAGCNAQGYIALISARKFKEALELVRETIPFPGVCGRVCGYCEESCNRTHIDKPVQIRALKRFVSDYEKKLIESGEEPAVTLWQGEKKGTIAIVGSGPAGLTAAYDCAKMGYEPVVFEVMPEPGGMLRYGIPEYRLPRDILDFEIDIIRKHGVTIHTSTPVGPELTINNLKEKGFKAIFLAIGTWKGKSLRIKGEDLEGVIRGVDFLREVNSETITPGNSPVKGKTVAVIGGGNTAIDAVRASLRLGAKKAFILYRRSRDQMPVSKEECAAAEAEGIEIRFLRNPVEITGKNGKVRQIICNIMRLGAPDASGRPRPVPVPGKTETFAVDIVIPAPGQGVNDDLLLKAVDNLDRTRDLITVDDLTLETNMPGVFAGGDAAGSGGYVVHAIAHGHEAAISMDRYIQGMDLKQGRKKEFRKRAETPPGYTGTQDQVSMKEVPVEQRIHNFVEVEKGFTEEEAVAEAERCLNCGICSECLQCEKVCEAKAVDHSQKESILSLHVGSVLLAPGCEKTDPHRLYHLGYGKYPDVVTSIQFERILSASGPFDGHIRCPSDNRIPEKIAFIQCAGSRDPASGNDHCSSVCCMYAMKEAVIAKEHLKSISPSIFYMDIRAHGKDFERYYERAKGEHGIRFVHARVSDVVKNGSGKLTLLFEKENGITGEEDFDMVILSIGFTGNGRLRGLADTIGLPLNKYGFPASDHFNSVNTKVPGIYQCGPAQEPKDIPDTVIQASAAAASASEILAKERWKEVTEKEYPDELDVSGQPPRIGVFVCHCGINIGGVVDVPDVVTYAQTLPGVVYAEDNLYTCSQDTQTHIKDMIKEHTLNRVIVASCTPRTHEPLFQETIREAGLNRHLFAMANIRDQCSWIHMNNPAEATRKSYDLLRMAVAKIALVEPLPHLPMDVTQRALVIGGGPAGMAASLSLAKQGFPVDLIEKESTLGGHLRKVLFSAGDRKTHTLLAGMLDDIKNHEQITLHLDSEVKEVTGFVGNYKTIITTKDDGEKELEHGVAIIATGAEESVPTEYLYGTNPLVKTNLEFEAYLATADESALPEGIVFIQCVGSREEDHMYCSKICCGETIKNALEVKKRKPGTEIYVLYRDIRTYGFSETYYRKAREKGIIFLRYDPDEKPVVTPLDSGLAVRITDTNTGLRMNIHTDMLVLAARIDPLAGNEIMSQHFKVPLTQDKFFLEAHVKLRPVDFATEGIYVAGMAHSPKTVTESIVQGKAAAARASTIICKNTFKAEATIAALNEDLCDGCGVCVGVCEFGALEIIELEDEKKIVKLSEALCKGCGGCVAACPSGAMEQKGFKDAQILAEIDAALI